MKFLSIFLIFIFASLAQISPISSGGTPGGAAGGSLTGTYPNPTIPDAAADGTTKGRATFTAADFNCTSGVCSLDYTNAQKATASVPGLLSAADWVTFNAKAANPSGGPIGGASTCITAGAVMFVGSAGVCGQDATTFFWDTVNKRLGIGTATPLTSFNVVETSTSSPRGILSSQYTSDTLSARLGFSKARGTPASPTTIVTGDLLGRLVFRGYDGTTFLEMASIEAGSTGTIGTNRVPTYIAFNTATDAAPSVLTERMRIDNAGVVSITGLSTSGGVLFAGSGGALTQDGGNFFYTDASDTLTVGPTGAQTTIGKFGSGSYGAISFNGAGSNYAFLGDATTSIFNAVTSLNFRTGNGANKITVTSSGVGVGPGNTSPTGTLLCYDATASTGVTDCSARAGAGQSTTALTTWYANNGTTVLARVNSDGSMKLSVTTVSGLATCNSTSEGRRHGVTDALTPVALATVAAGGSVHTAVYCDGTNWIVN